MVTATVRDPTWTKADDGTDTVICVPLSSLGFNACPPKVTIASSTKFVPLMVRVMEGDPATADAGETDETLGSGWSMTSWVAGESFPAKANAKMQESASLEKKRQTLI